MGRGLPPKCSLAPPPISTFPVARAILHAMSTVNPMPPAWPDSSILWQDRRVIVTGGSGLLGSYIVDKLCERGAAEIIVPCRRVVTR